MLKSIAVTLAGAVITVAITAGTLLSFGPIATADTYNTPKPYYWNIPTKPCKTEDSSNCYWDGGVRGNGKGRSFWTGRNGRVHYLDPAFRSGR